MIFTSVHQPKNKNRFNSKKKKLEKSSKKITASLQRFFTRLSFIIMINLKQSMNLKQENPHTFLKKFKGNSTK